ncbi:hypothetical protein [Kordia sp.]|uniref:hypothetical protein n=1 Tax=Kordia sp. TaxID=1965332 RepID=UPI003B5A190A
MTSSTLILNQGTKGEAQVKPSSYPAHILITFDPEYGDTEIFYGVNGQQPSIPLKPGQTPVTIDYNSLEISYRISQGQAKLQWDVQ